jgi:hypothetical protein
VEDIRRSVGNSRRSVRVRLRKYDSNVIKIDAGTVINCPSHEVQVESLGVAHFAIIDRPEVRRDGTGARQATSLRPCQAKPNSIRIAAICNSKLEHWKKSKWLQREPFRDFPTNCTQFNYFCRKLVSVCECNISDSRCQ